MNGIKLFNDLMEYADGKGASDVHLVPGRPAMLRIDGELAAAGQEDAAEWQDADLTEVTEQILSCLLYTSGMRAGKEAGMWMKICI